MRFHIQQSAVAQAAFGVIAAMPVIQAPAALAFLALDKPWGKALYLAGLGACVVWYLVAHHDENAAREKQEKLRDQSVKDREKELKDGMAAAVKSGEDAVAVVKGEATKMASAFDTMRSELVALQAQVQAQLKAGTSPPSYPQVARLVETVNTSMATINHVTFSPDVGMYKPPRFAPALDVKQSSSDKPK